VTLRLRRDGGPLLRIGHRGAAALAPANTLRSIELALETGVDLVELDVLGLPDGPVVLGHSRGELADKPLTFDDALAFLGERSPETGIVADVKNRGFEEPLVTSIRQAGAVERTVVSTTFVPSLQAVAQLEPGLARSLTYPRSRLGGADLGRTLPGRIGRLLQGAGASAATLNYRVISRAVVERCHALDAAVLAWTVNDPALAARLDRLGVDAVITDDPRIFRATLKA
jgi:glycerophosphoryl diester phosphodiesterase